MTEEECTLHLPHYGYDRLYAVGPYVTSRTSEGWEDLLSKHIRGLKKYRKYSSPLGQAMVLCVRHRYSELTAMDGIVPVPQTDEEKTMRKYNQAELLANIVGNAFQIPVLDRLEKKRSVKMVDLKGADKRWKAVEDLFASRGDVAGLKLMLLDDVSTTGATMSGCSKVLLDAGCASVTVYVAGRSVFTD